MASAVQLHHFTYTRHSPSTWKKAHLHTLLVLCENLGRTQVIQVGLRKGTDTMNNTYLTLQPFFFNIGLAVLAQAGLALNL